MCLSELHLIFKTWNLNAPPLHLPLIYADLYTEDLFTPIHSHLITAIVFRLLNVLCEIALTTKQQHLKDGPRASVSKTILQCFKKRIL